MSAKRQTVRGLRLDSVIRQRIKKEAQLSPSEQRDFYKIAATGKRKANG